jgi:hypothetical protein
MVNTDNSKARHWILPRASSIHPFHPPTTKPTSLPSTLITDLTSWFLQVAAFRDATALNFRTKQKTNKFLLGKFLAISMTKKEVNIKIYLGTRDVKMESGQNWLRIVPRTNFSSVELTCRATTELISWLRSSHSPNFLPSQSKDPALVHLESSLQMLQASNGIKCPQQDFDNLRQRSC